MIRIKRIKIQKIDISVFMLALACICFLSPFIQRTIGTLGMVLIVGLNLVVNFSYYPTIKQHEWLTFFCIVLYIGMIVLYRFLGKSDADAGLTTNVLFFLAYIAAVPLFGKLERRHCTFIVTVCLLTVFFTLFQNYRLWVRMGHRFTQQWYKYGIKEVVNTQYVAALVFASGMQFCAFLCRKRTWRRYLNLAIAAAMLLFNVIVTQRTIPMLLSIGMFGLLLLVNGELSSRRIIRYTLAGIALFVMALGYRVVLSTISVILGSDRMANRINSIITLLSTRSIDETGGGSLTARLYLMGVSIRTFFASPSNFFFGVGDKASDLVVGNHSYLFDEFAKYGVFGGLLSCVTVARMVNSAKRFSGIVNTETLYRMNAVILFIFAVRAVVGGILAPGFGAVMFIMFPFTFQLIKYEQEDLLESDYK